MHTNRRKNAGFTLVELMIVMTIIGILATIAIPSYIRAVNHAKEAVLREDLHTMRTAIDSYVANPRPMIIDVRISNNVISVPYRRLHYGQDA